MKEIYIIQVTVFDNPSIFSDSTLEMADRTISSEGYATLEEAQKFLKSRNCFKIEEMWGIALAEEPGHSYIAYDIKPVQVRR